MDLLHFDLPELHPQNVTILNVIALGTLAFILFWFTSQSERTKNFFFKRYSKEKASVRQFLFSKWLGLLVLGILPALILIIADPQFTLEGLGLNLPMNRIAYVFGWTGILGALVIPLAFLSARKEKNLVNYPQIRSKSWSKLTIFQTLTGWAVYLLGYEFLFRGILFFPLLNALGLWTTIGINTAMYSLSHAPKGLDETIGAIPLGVVLCILTYTSGNIWIAFLVHWLMAITNCFTAFYHHPDMHYQKYGKK